MPVDYIILSDGTRYQKVAEPVPVRLKVMHDFERYRYGVPDKPDIYPDWDWRMDLPEVYILQPEHSTPMTKAIQELSFALFRYGAPSLSDAVARDKWTKMMDSKIAFTNYNGFGDSGDPRANYILGENLDKELPLFDKPRVCGGYRPLSWRVEGTNLVVPVIDATKPLPSLAEVIERGLYFTSVSVGRNAAAEFPYAYPEPSLMLLIASRSEMYYPREKFMESNANPYLYQ